MQASTVVSSVWAWLYANGMTFRKISVGGQTVEQGLNVDQVQNIVNDFLPVVVDRIIVSHDWDFACDVATTTTVAATSEYTLEGNAGDCRDIINIRHGSGRGVVLERLNTLKTDRREGEDTDDSGSSDLGNVYGYTVYGRSTDGFPKIQIFDTPQEAKTLTYRYRKTGLTIENIPQEFGFVVRDMVLGQFKPEYIGLGEQKLGEMIGRYKLGGDEIDTIRLDPIVEAGNLRRNNVLQGGM